jgi:hypothetical protein
MLVRILLVIGLKRSEDDEDEESHTGRQQLKPYDFGPDRSNTWPNDAGKAAKENVNDKPGVVRPGEDPKKEYSQAGSQSPESGDIDSSKLVTR